MKVYRGPKSTEFGDDTHKLVDEPDIKKSLRLWHDEVLIRADVSKEAQDRFSVAHVSLDASDVLALHSALTAGLAARSANLTKAENRIAEAKQVLNSMYEVLQRVAPTYPSPTEDICPWEASKAITEALDLLGEAVAALGER
jgi:hypothetical protein